MDPTAGILLRAHFILARGVAELTANGKRVGDAVLDPPRVDTRKRALYRSEDVTALLKRGDNVFGVMIGEHSDVLVQARIELDDGTTLTVGSDAAWRSGPAPVRSANRFHGETYDARREHTGWDVPGFDDGGWQAVDVADGPRGTLSAAMLEPMRVIRTHAPVAVREVEDGVGLFDFGTNIAGWTRLEIDASRGTEITLKHGELIDAHGRINTDEIHARQTNHYIAAGNGVEVWQPRFVYAGFGYVEVTGLPGGPDGRTVNALEVHNDVRTVGRFDSSDDLLNRLHKANVQTQLNGMHGIPEDTPTREKRGWMADAHVAAQAVMNSLGTAAFYTTFIRDMRDAQRALVWSPTSFPWNRHTRGRIVPIPPGGSRPS